MDSLEFERGISISSKTGNNTPTQHFISGEFISPEEIIARMNRVIESAGVPLKFPRQYHKSSYWNTFQKVYWENRMMEIIREINSSPARISRIVMNKVAIKTDRMYGTSVGVQNAINDLTHKTLSRKKIIDEKFTSVKWNGDEPIKWVTPDILKWVGNK